MKKDITNLVDFGGNDGESLPLIKCACGKKFQPWDFILGAYEYNAKVCPDCGRRMFFSVLIRVYEVVDDD